VGFSLDVERLNYCRDGAYNNDRRNGVRKAHGQKNADRGSWSPARGQVVHRHQMMYSPEMPNPSRPASEFCKDRIRHFETKADHNKKEALAFFIALIFCTLASPLFIALGQDVFLSKVVPSVLSTVATGCAVWLQQRKPQQLWSLYRTMQRQLENELNGFEFLISDYRESTEPEKLLAERTAVICANAHQLWVPLIPSPDSLASALTADQTQLNRRPGK